MNLRESSLGFVLLLLVALFLQLVPLPDFAAPARPLWVALVFAFWTYVTPKRVSLLLAFVVGVALDVLLNTVLGQHALGLIVAIYAVARMRSFLVMVPFWQTTLVLAPVWALYAFLMFWIDGARGQQADAWLRWMPVASSTLLWPLLFPLLNRLGKPARE